MKKIIKAVAFILILLTIFSSVFVQSAFAVSADAKKKQVILTVDDAAPVTVFTTANTIAEFFAAEGLSLSQNDKINKQPEDAIEPGMSIEYSPAITIILYLDDTRTEVSTKKQTIKSFMQEYSNHLGFDLYYDETLDDFKIKDGSVLEARTKSTIITVEKVVLKYKEESFYSEQLAKGVAEITQAGINGEADCIYSIEYANGVQVNKTLISSIEVIKPISEITMIGTAESIPYGSKMLTGVLEAPTVFKEKLTMNATAYTANYVCTGKNPGDKYFGITASGMKAQVGVVAVDPKVIPLGTELFIEGYGFAIAGDTGGAIKGNKIDLYYDTYNECLQFGRKNIVVYVLS